jgi:hypothetical protein
MVWRVADEAVGGQVDESEGQPVGLERNLDTVCRGRLSLSDRQHAHRDERAILAAIAFLSVRAALHVIGHGSHITHLTNRHPLCHNWGYQRRNNQPDDHKDRQQTTDESAKIHDLSSHGIGNLGRLFPSHVRQLANRAC